MANLKDINVGEMIIMGNIEYYVIQVNHQTGQIGFVAKSMFASGSYPNAAIQYMPFDTPGIIYPNIRTSMTFDKDDKVIYKNDIYKIKGVSSGLAANPCECGAHATFMPDSHSLWCPMFKQNQ